MYRCYELFDQIDPTGAGVVDVAAVIRIFDSFGIHSAAAEEGSKRVIAAYGTSNTISRDQFVLYWLSLTTDRQQDGCDCPFVVSGVTHKVSIAAGISTWHMAMKS
eukprot:SAG31_NODE_1900_length_6960_cov_7.923626_2_plen_105_part_00